MKKIMDSFRVSPPLTIGSQKVVKAIDFGEGTVKDLLSGQEGKTTLPKSNVLYYAGESGTWMCIRPSGTEPKIKVYFGAHASAKKESVAELELMMSSTMTDFEDRKNAKG